MKHHGSLNKGEMGPLIKCLLVAKVVNVMCIKLIPLPSLDGKVFDLRFHTKLDEVSNCRLGLSNNFRD